MPCLWAGSAEGEGRKMHWLRSGSEPPKQKKRKKDLRGIRGVVFSVVSNNQPKNKMNTFTLVCDQFGNFTFFPDGEVPQAVHGQLVEILESGLTWQEAHDKLNA